MFINKHTEQTKQRMRLSKLGKNNPNFGKKTSEETKKKMSLAQKAKPNSGRFRKGHNTWNKGIKGEANHNFGKKRSLEVRQKISEARKGMKFTEQHIKNMSKAIQGNKHWNWKGGRTELRELLRTNKFYRAWRQQVIERDNFTCQLCGTKTTELNVDHYPKSFVSILIENGIKNLEQALDCEALFDIINGRTLCISCHKGTANYGGYRMSFIGANHVKH